MMTKNGTEARLEEQRMRKDLQAQLDAAVPARNEKLQQAVDHLRNQLEMTSKKYLTVNGYMQARTTLEEVLFGEEGFEYVDECRWLAQRMSDLAKELLVELDATTLDTIDESLIESRYSADFVTEEFTPIAATEQLLIMNILQNLGPVLDDIVQARAAMDHEIEKLTKALEEVGVTPGQLELADAEVVELHPVDVN
jgi:hypothetical protein